MSHRSTCCKKPPIQGFTLIEFLVACSIISIIATSACISLHAYTEKLYLKREALKLQLFLERFYATALTFRQRITIMLSEQNVIALGPTAQKLGESTFSRNTTCDLPDSNPLLLYFHPTISTSPKTILLKRGASACRVIVSLRGRIRVAC